MTPDALLTLRKHLRIAHHVPGRLRIRYAASILKDAPDLATNGELGALEAVEGVSEVALRLSSFSLLIVYDPRRIPPQTWEAILTGPEDDAETLLARYMST